MIGVSGLLMLAACIAAMVDHRIALMSQRQAEVLAYHATHDELTRLANRRQLRERFLQLLDMPEQLDKASRNFAENQRCA